MVPVVQEGILIPVQRQDARVAKVDLWGIFAAGEVALHPSQGGVAGDTAGIAVAPAAAIELNHPPAGHHKTISTLNAFSNGFQMDQLPDALEK